MSDGQEQDEVESGLVNPGHDAFEGIDPMRGWSTLADSGHWAARLALRMALRAKCAQLGAVKGHRQRIAHVGHRREIQ